MANSLYDKARNAFLKGEISWKDGGDTFRAYLVDIDGTGFTPDLAADEFLDDIPAASLLAYVALLPADPVAGVADAADLTFWPSRGRRGHRHRQVGVGGCRLAPDRLHRHRDRAAGDAQRRGHSDHLGLWGQQDF